ncbi:hypothetical protein [Kitasatospora purpeofusca]|uniref:hypothetical protein n=1 Tax=Kitasatospora purpeofusca TaxID=67352 RepID=UPI0037FBA364
MNTTVVHDILAADGPHPVQAEHLPSGLYVYEIPADIDRGEPCRWRVGHHSGRFIASTRDRDAAFDLATDIADWADWNLDADTLHASIVARSTASRTHFLECVRMAGGHLSACSDYGPYGC